jgi:hypothetical protein
VSPEQEKEGKGCKGQTKQHVDRYPYAARLPNYFYLSLRDFRALLSPSDVRVGLINGDPSFLSTAAAPWRYLFQVQLDAF